MRVAAVLLAFLGCSERDPSDAPGPGAIEVDVLDPQKPTGPGGEATGRDDPGSDVDGDGDGDGRLAEEDCDDADPTVHPGAEEVPYDGVDQDCDGADLVDVDGDGVAATAAGGADCADADPAVFPGAAEVPYDGVDQDCDGADLVDVDGDGVAGAAAGGADCDDTDPALLPGVVDVPYDGVDQDCDGADLVDVDGDGVAAAAAGGADCDDADPAVLPGAVEVWYDGLDQDCDGACDGDQDGDGSVLEGWTVTDGDPCDADATVGQGSAPTDCDDTNPLAEARLLSTVPADGSTDAHPWRPLSATLSEADPTGAIVLLDGSGAAVSGGSAWSGTTLVFTPAATLEPLTTYTAELTWACGTERWTFATDDGTAQDFLHEWTPGPPDTLSIEILNPVATIFGFGMAETGTGPTGWYGEDCAGALATGSCHLMRSATLVLESVHPNVGSVVPGQTTWFQASSDAAITWYAEARDGPQVGSCWAWGHDPGYFPSCTPL